VALSPAHLRRVALGPGAFRDRSLALPAPRRRPDLPGRAGSRCRAADQCRQDPHRRAVDLGVPRTRATYGLCHPAPSVVRSDGAGPRKDFLAARPPRLVSLRQHGGQRRRRGEALRSSEIVVATPEKLDFALRSDPSVLDDVGLVLLDEGHMIGASEREVRYESPNPAAATSPERLDSPHPLSLGRLSLRDRARRLRRMDHRRRARRATPRGLAPDAATLRPCRVARRARTTDHHLRA
jgi:hypothetical protein